MKARWMLWFLPALLMYGQLGQSQSRTEGRRSVITTQTETDRPESIVPDKPRDLSDKPAVSSFPFETETGVLAFSNYRLGSEDLIYVQVMDSPEFSRQARVTAEGLIKLPLVKKPIVASGKTTAELEQEIARLLVDEGLLREPLVSVTLREPNSKPVSVVGAVRNPLVFQALRPLLLTEAIAKAGGISEIAGPEAMVLVPERDGKPSSVVKVSLKNLLESPDPKDNLLLRGGEEVRVPNAGRIYILGGVNRPGAVLVNVEEQVTLLRALALAGGTTPTASPKAFLLRPSANGPEKKQIAINLKKLMKRQEPDLPLQTNDVIFIPDSRSPPWKSKTSPRCSPSETPACSSTTGTSITS
ncbi:MAG: polysaccharide biosynthesis/export family protein [Acidobacteria bacterium]|nr:polysaccharide biosynthesis/export family protein [Acidobacteriota bacterium]